MPAIALSTRLRRAAAAAVLALLPLTAASAADEHYLKDGIAGGGVDVVAYHTAGRPTDGDPRFTAEHDGRLWRFASAANRDLFLADPARYAPAYGGWCAAGASLGRKVPTRPQYWAIVDGRLYLNANAWAHEQMFLADTPGTIRKGDEHWKVIRSTPAGDL